MKLKVKNICLFVMTSQGPPAGPSQPTSGPRLTLWESKLYLNPRIPYSATCCSQPWKWILNLLSKCKPFFSHLISRIFFFFYMDCKSAAPQIYVSVDRVSAGVRPSNKAELSHITPLSSSGIAVSSCSPTPWKRVTEGQSEWSAPTLCRCTIVCFASP